MKLRQFLRWLPPVVLTAASALVIWQRQAVIDWWRLRGYVPSARVVALADDTTMNPSARRVFYVNRPQLEGKQDFNNHCNQDNEETIVLGCYVSNRGIYIYDVTEPRLKGIHEVTAAHELLHAAYDRLGKSERTDIDKKLTNFLATLDNDRIKQSVESYRNKDASSVPNELHSIIGTEVRNLTPELEAYYSQYFTNRLKIVEYSEQYEKAFNDIKNRVAALDAELAKLKLKIEANEAELSRLADEINADRRKLDAMLAAGDQQGYNAAVPGFNAKVRRYNSLVAATRELINRYNRIIEERNALASEEQQLIEAIDSRPQEQR